MQSEVELSKYKSIILKYLHAAWQFSILDSVLVLLRNCLRNLQFTQIYNLRVNTTFTTSASNSNSFFSILKDFLYVYTRCAQISKLAINRIIRLVSAQFFYSIVSPMHLRNSTPPTYPFHVDLPLSILSISDSNCNRLTSRTIASLSS